MFNGISGSIYVHVVYVLVVNAVVFLFVCIFLFGRDDTN